MESIKIDIILLILSLIWQYLKITLILKNKFIKLLDILISISIISLCSFIIYIWVLMNDVLNNMNKGNVSVIIFLSIIILFYFQKILVLVFAKKIILKKLYIYISIIFEIVYPIFLILNDF